jgi:thiol-disulfide isomerase/thioredoxin
MLQQPGAERPARRHRRTKPILLVAAATLIVGGVVAPSVISKPQPERSAGQPVATGNRDTSPSAPSGKPSAISTADVDTLALASKPTVLFFMTSEGCGACMEEAAALNRLAPTWGNAVDVVGVEMVPGTPDSYLQAFSAAVGGLSFPLAVDDGRLVDRFDVQAVDTTVVLDRHGREVFRDAVPSDETTLRQAVARAQDQA